MLRTRIFWFTLGCGSAGAAISHLMLKDFWLDRESVSSELKQKFDHLDARISMLENSPASAPSNSHQDDANIS